MFRSFTLSLLLSFTAHFAFAQGTPILDTVALGANYSNQAYYSVVTGATTYAPRNAWDVAFQSFGITFGIWVNEANGIVAYLAPNVDASDFGTAIDTTGLSTWPRLQNSTTAWQEGALNQNSSGGFDVGWGVYTGPPNHEVNGDSIYLLKYANGTVKQLLVQNLSVARYKFTYADLDGNNVVVDSVLKDNSKNLSYYSLTNEQEVNPEPTNNAWDLWFTSGLTAEFIVGAGFWSNPAGYIYLNRGVQAAAVSGVDAETYEDYASATFDSTINTIGISYRFRDGMAMTWAITDSIVYFVKAKDGEYYKLRFTGFEGQGSGVIAFEKTQLTFPPATGVEDVASATRFALYPNPVAEQLSVVLDAAQAGRHNITVTDLAGKVLYTTEVLANGLQNINIPVSTLAGGYYLVSVDANGSRSVQKFVKQ